MTQRIGFTERRLKDLQPTSDKQTEYFDTTDRLFGIRVSPGGTKTFFVKKRVHGVLIRVCLGTWPDVSLLKAREAFHEAFDQLRKGINPNFEKKRRTAQNMDRDGILSAVFDSYLADKRLKPVSVQSYRYNFKNLSAWSQKRVEDITAEMVQAKFREVSNSNGHYTANRVFALLKCLMAHSMKKLKRPSVNPCANIEFHKETPRRVNLAPETLPAFIAALDNIKGNAGTDLYRLLLFTGLRKSDAMELKWSNIDLEKKTLYVAETKNGEPLHIPLSGFVAGLLKGRKQKAQGAVWVFPSHSRTGHITNTSNFDRQLAEYGIKTYPHMLRKRFTTTAKILCPAFAVDILTAHIPAGSVTDKNYTIPSPEELRPFVERITAELLRMAGIEHATAAKERP